MNNAMLEPEEQVLSTLQADGSRRWLKPKLSKGDFLQWRRWLAYILIVVFTVLPFIKIAGKPLILLDITARRFTILGFTFLPTDTVLLAIFVVGLLLSVFLFTALFGRVWCGWACPQTVYMEFVFRPIERLFEGTSGRGGCSRKEIAGWRTVGKYIAYFLICIYLANTFLAYFIGVDRLSQWVTQSPLQHPVPFLVMAFVTTAMMFDFCFFREQMCLVACPYGRFQSVLLDRDSLIVAYDIDRGDPRGKMKRTAIKSGSDDTADLPVLGDCVDCGNCVTTCPTGIDIRDGLQMECINCTQCIDACNQVMKKCGREPSLIRFSSQARDSGEESGLLRARTVIYPLLIVGIVAAFLIVFLSSKSFDAVALRVKGGNPHTLTDDGQVRNLMKLKLTNRSDQPMQFTITVLEPVSAQINQNETNIEVEARAVETFDLNILAARSAFTVGRANLRLRVANQLDEARNLNFRLLGPYD